MDCCGPTPSCRTGGSILRCRSCCSSHRHSTLLAASCPSCWLIACTQLWILMVEGYRHSLGEFCFQGEGEGVASKHLHRKAVLLVV